MKKTLLIVLSLFFLATGNSQVTNLKTGLWSDVTNWSTNTLPNDTTDIKLSFDITIDINASCRSFNTNGHTVTVNPNVAVTILGTGKFIFDTDGNAYDTVGIGSQVWLKQNLAVSHYNNGDTIPEVEDSVAWVNLTTGAWCYYETSSANGMVYGKLYNWYAVTDARGLAPDGWHVPSDSEWTVLTSFLGEGDLVAAGGKMKEAGTAHWISPNDGDHSSGFLALPGGYRSDYLGGFYTLGYNAFWWSSTAINAFYGWNRFVDDSGCMRSYGYKIVGYSVRCVKN